jgi:hypothetical protein
MVGIEARTFSMYCISHISSYLSHQFLAVVLHIYVPCVQEKDSTSHHHVLKIIIIIIIINNGTIITETVLELYLKIL